MEKKQLIVLMWFQVDITTTVSIRTSKATAVLATVRQLDMVVMDDWRTGDRRRSVVGTGTLDRGEAWAAVAAVVVDLTWDLVVGRVAHAASDRLLVD